MLRRGGADGLIVSGTATGQPADAAELRAVRSAAQGSPVFVGSGITADNVAEYLDAADGLIVGTWVKADGMVGHPVDPQRVKALLDRLPRTA